MRCSADPLGRGCTRTGEATAGAWRHLGQEDALVRQTGLMDRCQWRQRRRMITKKVAYGATIWGPMMSNPLFSVHPPAI